MSGLLQGKTALVTGGSKGVGRAICLALAREGANVAFNFTRSKKEANELLEKLRELGCKAWAYQVSVTDRVATQNMVRELEAEIGQVDILVNNAGFGQVVPVALMEESDWDQMMDTHVKGAFLTSQAVLRGMIRVGRGRILNMSSLAGVKMMLAPVHYCAAKAAIKGFTEGLAKEVGRYGILVNCIAPGILDEGVSVHLPDNKLKEYLAHCSLGRVGKVEEIAEYVAFLVSDRNSFMNGATVVLDGGV
jgi:3-oxoacyl-[acyl-carrier protein] reductase